MDNDAAGVDTVRHLFVLLIGLGMRESSGKYCEGRDKSASNRSAETAEAGLFQLTMHPHIIGHRSRMAILEELIEYISGHHGVWWATHAAIAEYVRSSPPAPDS